MNRKRAILTFVTLTAIATLAWWALRSSSDGESPLVTETQQNDRGSTASPTDATTIQQVTPARTQEERMREAVEKIESVLATPITFSGRVVDQNGDPVANAKVGFSLLDKFMASGSNGETVTDTNGYFTITGVKGAVLGVNASKRGYYQIHNVSNQRFAYGVGSDGYTKPPPTKDDPAILVLQKAGEAAALIQVSSRQIDLPQNGGSLTIDLASGQTGRGGLQLSSQIGNTSQRPFYWRYHFGIQGGGLIEREEKFAFEAPLNGYVVSTEVTMPTDAERWSSRLTKEYFAKLSDGRYARFSIRFYAGDRNFVVLESYVNPEPGNRNLEFDPEKAVKSP